MTPGTSDEPSFAEAALLFGDLYWLRGEEPISLLLTKFKLVNERRIGSDKLSSEMLAGF